MNGFDLSTIHHSMSSSDYVRLESSDGYTFVVARNVACASGMLSRSLDAESTSYVSASTLTDRIGGFGESNSGVCNVSERYEPILNDQLINRGVIVLKVIEYLSYKVQYADFNAADIKDDFTDRIDPYIALEL